MFRALDQSESRKRNSGPPLKCVTNLIDLMNFLSVRSTRHIYSLKLFWLSGTRFFVLMKCDNFKLALSLGENFQLLST